MSTKSEVHQVMVRRAPRFSAFMIGGGVLGAIGAVIVTGLFPVDPAVGFLQMAAYFSLYGIAGGVLLGAIVALIVDRGSFRRTTLATAEHETVSQDPGPAAPTAGPAPAAAGPAPAAEQPPLRTAESAPPSPGIPG